MPELSGPIQPLELASWLWLIPFFPVAGALTNALYCSGFLAMVVEAMRAAVSSDGARPLPLARVVSPPRTVARVAIGSLALAAVTSIAYCGVLLQLPEDERFLFRHLWQLVRVGPLDVGVDLVLDPLSAVLVLLVTVLGTLVAVYARASGDVGDASGQWRFFGWFGAFVSSMIVLVLADNAALLLLGWQGVALAGYGLVGFAFDGTGRASGGETGTRAFLVQRAADTGMVLGVALLFWGLGGTWDQHGEYQAEISPRLAAVAVTGQNAPAPRNDPGYSGERAVKGKGFLTVTALPDSLVYLDESRTPLLDAGGLPLRTPFRRYEIAGGAHSLRIAPDDRFHDGDRDAKAAYVLEGGVLTNYSIPHTAFGADHEVAISVLGPTLKFREIRDQLVLMDPMGAHPGRDGFGVRRLGGLPGVAGLELVTVACVLMLLGALAKSAQLPFHAWLAGTATASASASALIQGGGMAMAGVYLVARLGFLFSLSHAAAFALVAVGLATALRGALASVFSLDLRRVLASTTASQIGLAFVALGAGAYGSAVFQVATHAIVKTCLLLSAGAVIARPRRAAPDSPDALAASDLRDMGGLATAMPGTARAYRVACFALAAAPVPLLAGFWSTGAVLEQTFAANALPVWVARGAAALVLVTAALTSFGIWRSYYLVFEGKSRGAAARPMKKAKQGSALAVRVLAIVATLAAASGAVLGASAREFGGVGDSLIEGWLAPVFSTVPARFAEIPTGLHLVFFAVLLTVAYLAWASARRRYGAGRRDDWATREATPAWLGATPR